MCCSTTCLPGLFTARVNVHSENMKLHFWVITFPLSWICRHLMWWGHLMWINYHHLWHLTCPLPLLLFSTTLCRSGAGDDREVRLHHGFQYRVHLHSWDLPHGSQECRHGNVLICRPHWQHHSPICHLFRQVCIDFFIPFYVCFDVVCQVCCLYLRMYFLSLPF